MDVFGLLGKCKNHTGFSSRFLKSHLKKHKTLKALLKRRVPSFKTPDPAAISQLCVLLVGISLFSKP